jgi:hypothetical protein
MIYAKDVTFIIPVKFDHQDRKENLDLTIKFIKKYFDTNIIIGEQGTIKFGSYSNVDYMTFPYEEFHRTKMLNQMTMVAKTPIVVNWDADVLVAPDQLDLAFDAIRQGMSDFIYPYDGRFARVSRDWLPKLKKLDLSILDGVEFPGMRSHDKESVGGAIVFDKESFIMGGMENENFMSHAPEDVERYWRFNMLGFNVDRVTGTLYHINHWCGPDSGHGNDFAIMNRSEWRRVKGMDKNELKEYISTWPWVPKMLL